MHRFSSLRFRLAGLVLLAALPALGLAVYTGMEERQMAENDGRSAALRVARVLSGQGQDEIQEAHQFLASLADMPQMRDGDPGACQDLLHPALKDNPGYVDLKLIRPDGQIVCSGMAADVSPDIPSRASFQKAAETGRMTTGDYGIDPRTGRAALPLFHPVLDPFGKVEGVAEAVLDVRWFNQLASQSKVQAGWTMSLIGQDGTILAQYPDGSAWVGKKAPTDPLLRSRLEQASEGTAEAAGPDQSAGLYAFSRMDPDTSPGAYVAVEIPSAVAVADEERILLRNLALLGLVTAMALGATWFFGDVFVVRRIQSLLNATRRLAAGDLRARAGVKGRTGELDELARGFDQMAESLEQRSEQLGAAEAKYRTLVEQVPAVTYIAALDEKSTGLYVSPQLESLLGFTPTEWLTQPEAWLQQLHPDDRGRVLSELVRSRALSMPFSTEYRVRARDGRIVWLRDQAVIVRDERGQPLFLQGILMDITERKHYEEQLVNLNEELERRVVERTSELSSTNTALEAANKELEAFSYSVSHDLRAPVRSIGGFAGLILAEYATQLPAEAERFIRLIRDNAESMDTLIEDLLDFSRFSRQPMKKERVAVSQLVDAVLAGARRENADRRVEFVIGDLPECEADPVLIKQVFVNLVSNALKYSRKRDAARVEVGSFREQGAIVYFVKDNGVGFDMKQAGHLFGVFQRLHSLEEYEGTGVGLALVERIIHRHGGRVWAEAAVDEGATFYFALPDDAPANGFGRDDGQAKAA